MHSSYKIHDDPSLIPLIPPQESYLFTRPSYLERNKRALRTYLRHVKGTLCSRQGLADIWSQCQSNWKSGLAVALVNLPLSISLAVAGSGYPSTGVLTAIWAGFLASLFGGSDYNITGPTGALSGILSHYVSSYGVDILPFLALTAGLVTLLVFVLEWEKYVILVPSAVTEGFTLGVALIIALNQLNFVLGLPSSKNKGSLIQNVVENLRDIKEANGTSVIVFALTLTTMLILIKRWPRVPWVIFVSIFGILLGYGMAHDYIRNLNLPSLEKRFGELSFKFAELPKLKYWTKLGNLSLMSASLRRRLLLVLLLISKVERLLKFLPF
jgi:MFS superfamily sulfate permease-like transporter